MAGITASGGWNMCGGFTGSRYPVMTGGAAAGYLAMVNPCYRRPAVINMAGIAVVAGINVPRVFASGGCAIMAA